MDSEQVLMMCDDMALKPGVLALDMQRGKVGEVMDHWGAHIQLRPKGGGREWDAHPDEVRPLGDDIADGEA
ncbi:hypothetical protein [Streptomyces sp.]|uniref:hypothetical protein n=1 Tax=Streptomyces sp. TaxID=1931 RepID=UPI002D794410|nr:hypothetical protein [Streptomyces sp.]HET6357341.1 hypothetical protein [Streptomyces sp.]